MRYYLLVIMPRAILGIIYSCHTDPCLATKKNNRPVSLGRLKHALERSVYKLTFAREEEREGDNFVGKQEI